MRKTLAEIPRVGKVVVCESCDRIHFMFGRLTLDMTREEFFGLKELVNDALENFQSGPIKDRKSETDEKKPFISEKTEWVH